MDALHQAYLLQAAQSIKMENSPAESLMSTPGDDFSSLFESTSALSPMDVMTPVSTFDDKASHLSAVPEEMDSPSPSADSDKKPTKKRKSWGQVLPEPKTNLPPRKRAKTEDEKEQRRVERVLRNRRAAQSSRERKRQEVDALEERNKQLEEIVAEVQKTNQALMEELQRFRSEHPVAARVPSTLESLKENVTLSPQLFGVQEGDEVNSVIDEFVNTHATVNPASLSPPQVVDSFDHLDSDDQTQASMPPQTDLSAQTSTSSSDLTQRPAAMLYDLQCQKSEEKIQSPTPAQVWSMMISLSLQLRMMLLSVSAIFSACQTPMAQIALCVKTPGLSLHPSPRILTTIIWLVTRPRASSTNLRTDSTSQSSSTKRQTTPHYSWKRPMTLLRSTSASSRNCSTLRIKSLRKILSSSPNLARPLQDATIVAMRLVSQGADSRGVTLLSAEKCIPSDVDHELTQCLSSIVLPSMELLMTLLWTLRVEEQRMNRWQGTSEAATIFTDVNFDCESGVPVDNSTNDDCMEGSVEMTIGSTTSTSLS